MARTTHRPAAAAVWMLGSIAGFSALAVSGREIGATLDTFEIMLSRSLIGVAVVGAAAVATGRQAEIRARNMRLHLLRNTLHFAGQNLWLYALPLIPLAHALRTQVSRSDIEGLTLMPFGGTSFNQAHRE